MHQLIHSSLRFHSLTRYDYCMILMKNLTWILTRRNLTNLFMTNVRIIGLPLILIAQDFKQIRFICFLLPDDMKFYPHQYEIKFSPA